jgi:hypothetical protein
MGLKSKDEAVGIISVKKQPKQVCILGTAETLKEAPFDDKTWDMWAVASAIGHPDLKRVDRVLELHEPDNWKLRVDEINKAKIPVWMWKHYDEIPLSEKFPIDEVLGKFRRYFTNSISFLIAEAIREGYTDIALFGVHMATVGEYSSQRPSCEYFLGYAEAKGINLWIPDGADILKAARMYGFEPEGEIKKKIRNMSADMEQKKMSYQQQEANNHDMKMQAVGWTECLKHVTQILGQ